MIIEVSLGQMGGGDNSCCSILKFYLFDKVETMLLLHGYTPDNNICLGWVTGDNERMARVWQLVDDSNDSRTLIDVPTLTFNSTAAYTFASAVFTHSKAHLIKTKMSVTNEQNQPTQQYQFFRSVSMDVSSGPVMQLYKVLPDGTPLLRPMRDVQANDQTHVLHSVYCSILHVSAILPLAVPSQQPLAIQQGGGQEGGAQGGGR